MKKFEFVKYKLYLPEDISQEELEKAKDEKRYVGMVKGVGRFWDEEKRVWESKWMEFHMITEEPVVASKHWFVGVDVRVMEIRSRTICNAYPFVGYRAYHDLVYDWDTHSFRTERMFHYDYAMEFKVRKKGKKEERFFLPMFLCEKGGVYGYYDANSIVDDYTAYQEKGGE